ncbi:MAG: tetratricopeptide repeat protein [Stenotrophobium sp.]
MQRLSNAIMTSRRFAPAPAAVMLLAALALSACSLLPKRTGSLPVKPAQAAQQPTANTPLAAKNDPDARFKAALDLMKQKQNPDAEKAFAELAKDFPQYSGPFTDLGILYGRSNRRPEALSSFSRAVALNPQNAVAWNWLGVLYRQSGNYAQAEQAYKKALAIASDNAAAHLNLGILYDEYLKRPADALPQYKDYQRLGGADDLRVLVWVAQIEKSQADAAKAAPAAAPKPPVGPAPKAQPAKKTS